MSSPAKSRLCHERFLLSLDSNQRIAYLAVDLFLVSVGECLRNEGLHAHLMSEELHTLFPAFGRKMGIPEELFLIQEGMCPAVSLYFCRGGEGEKYITFPVGHYLDSIEFWSNHPDKEKARAAALLVCKEWISNIDWSTAD